MEGFLFITLILCFYFLNRNINNKFKEQNLTIEDLKNRLRFLQNEILSKKTASETKETVVAVKKPVKEEPIKVVKPAIIVPEKSIEKTIQPVPVVDTPQKPISTITQKQVVKQKIKTAPKKSWLKSFKEKNPDLEKFSFWAQKEFNTEENMNAAFGLDIPVKDFTYRVGWDSSNTVRVRLVKKF